MSEKHLSSKFDADLSLLSTRLLEMGELAESQIARALDLLDTFDEAIVQQVLESGQRLYRMEREIDEEVSHVIARRQPAARDLRLLMATSKCVTNLERSGDEARKVAERVRRIHENGGASAVKITEIKDSGLAALDILRRAVDAFTQMDTVAAAQIVRDDVAFENEFLAFERVLVAKMTEDPLAISIGLEYMHVAKAIERIADHARNIAEFVFYEVEGTDVRHVPHDQLEGFG